MRRYRPAETHQKRAAADAATGAAVVREGNVAGAAGAVQGRWGVERVAAVEEWCKLLPSKQTRREILLLN